MKCFDKVLYADGKELAEEENVGPGTVGTAIDCLTRVLFGAKPEEAFSISLAGAKVMESVWYVDNAKATCSALVAKTKAGDTNEAITAACQLAGCFDACYRSGHFKQPEELAPDDSTISNIRIMLERCRTFIEDQYGPVLLSGFTFEGGYTDIVSYGDGDFLLAGGLFDFKTMKGNPSPKHSLQLLMYYLMGLASDHPEFKNVSRIGFFNPRLNIVYTLDTAAIPEEVLREVSIEIIGYNEVPEGAGRKPNTKADFPRIPQANMFKPIVF